MPNKKFQVPINLVNLASDPVSGSEGDMYYNTTSDFVKVYANGYWINIGSSSETNSIFTASPAYYITSQKITNWDTSYGWGNHTSAGYLTSSLASTTYLTQNNASSTYLTQNNATSTYQSKDSDLTDIAALSANGILRKSSGTWAMDNNTYLTSAVTSISATPPLSTGGSPITSTGTITLDQTQISIGTSQVSGLDNIISLLTPAKPPNYPNNVALVVGSQYRIAVDPINQTTNGNSTITQTIGSTVYATFGNTFTTSTSSGTGSGTSGTITVDRNNTTGVITKVLNSTDNTGTTVGTNNNLIISANPSYGTPSGFWKTLTMYVTGTAVPSGWNRIKINHSQSGTPTYATADFYYDTNSGTPIVSATSIAVLSSTTTYSSGIPHYATATFNINVSVAKVIGDTYPYGTDTFLTTNATGIFGSGSRTYALAGVTIGQNQPPIGTPLAISTPVSMTASGFGSNPAATKPTVYVTNSFGTTQQPMTGVSTDIILYKTATNTSMEETAISSDFVNPPSINNSRITFTNNTGDTVAPNGVTVYASTTLLGATEAKVVGGVLKWDNTNYAATTGTKYLPLGPNYSTHTGTQYFTFKFKRASTSKFNIYLTSSTGINGCWVAVPGSDMDTSCAATGGWMDMSKPAGTGIIGPSSPGTSGTNGCAISSSVIPLSTVSVNPLSGSYTCTFNSYSTSSTATNEVYVRIALASGQSITSLSIGTATR